MAKVHEVHIKANREVQKSAKMDKQNYICCLAEEAEQAAGSGNMRQQYDTTRKLAGKSSKPERPAKDKQGRNIMGTKQELNRWAEDFEELLNRSSPLDPPPQTYNQQHWIYPSNVTSRPRKKSGGP